MRTSTNTPAPASAAASTNGASESRPSSGLAVKASTPSPLTAPPEAAVVPTRAWAYAAAVTGTSPRLPSAMTSSSASRAARAVRPNASQPGAPSRSKHASWNLTATQAGPAASITAAQ